VPNVKEAELCREENVSKLEGELESWARRAASVKNVRTATSERVDCVTPFGPIADEDGATNESASFSRAGMRT
jgi:hypothetical protein